jgi:c-di-GMP-binding flagellar brake protein YcgR
MWATPRQHPRFKTALPVELRATGLQAPLRARTEDVSLGGLYVEMTCTQNVATEVEIVLWIGEKKIRAKGMVVSNHPAFGNGVKFTEIEQGDKDELRSFLTGLEKSLAPRPSLLW